MTVLRSNLAAVADVRAFVASEPLMVADDKPDPLEALAAQIAALQDALQDGEQAARQGAKKARSEGYADGVEAAERDFEARSGTLANAAQAAADDFAASLARVDELAVLVARSALAKLLDGPEAKGDLVVSAIRRQLSALRREAVVAIHVSPIDFPTPDSLAAAGRAVRDLDLVADAELSPGGCVVKLKLGEVDIGPSTQWSALSDLLARAAGGADQ